MTSSVSSLSCWMRPSLRSISELSLDSLALVEDSSSAMSMPAASSVPRTMRTAESLGTSGGRFLITSAALSTVNPCADWPPGSSTPVPTSSGE